MSYQIRPGARRQTESAFVLAVFVRFFLSRDARAHFLTAMVPAKRSLRMKRVLSPRVSALVALSTVLFAQVALAARRHSSSSSGSGSGWTVIIGMIIFFVAFVALIFYLDRRRSQKIEAIAKSLGLTFRRKPTDADRALAVGSYLANEGHGHTVSNVLEAARSDELNFTIFDYQYTVGYGKSSSTYYQTVTRMQSALFQLPTFILYPETFFAKMGKAFGKSDINFPESPEFSGKFILRGDDEAAIRALFNPALRQALEPHSALTIEGAGDLLFIFRAARRSKPDELPGKIEQDKRIAAIFFEAQRSASAYVQSGPGRPPPLPPPLPIR